MLGRRSGNDDGGAPTVADRKLSHGRGFKTQGARCYRSSTRGHGRDLRFPPCRLTSLGEGRHLALHSVTLRYERKQASCAGNASRGDLLPSLLLFVVYCRRRRRSSSQLLVIDHQQRRSTETRGNARYFVCDGVQATTTRRANNPLLRPRVSHCRRQPRSKTASPARQISDEKQPATGSYVRNVISGIAFATNFSRLSTRAV